MIATTSVQLRRSQLSMRQTNPHKGLGAELKLGRHQRMVEPMYSLVPVDTSGMVPHEDDARLTTSSWALLSRAEYVRGLLWQ